MTTNFDMERGERDMQTHVKEAIDFWDKELERLYHTLGVTNGVLLLQDAPEIMETDTQWVWTLRIKFWPNINQLLSAIHRWKDWKEWRDHEYVVFDIVPRPAPEVGTIICIVHKKSIPDERST